MDLASFATVGAVRVRAAFTRQSMAVLGEQLDAAIQGRPGRRLTAGPWTQVLPPLNRIAARLIGEAAFPVRAVVFDKTPEMNWALGWHQGRTVAVRERIEADGFGPWSVKDGVTHVEPPVEVLQGMVTLRLHIDDCDEDNAPLLVAPGSHALGRIPAHEAAAVAARAPVLTCLAEAGDVWAYATLILHASERSRSHGRRRVLQVDFAAAPLPGGLQWKGI